jgi:hypothetical protein
LLPVSPVAGGLPPPNKNDSGLIGFGIEDVLVDDELFVVVGRPRSLVDTGSVVVIVAIDI